MDTILKTENIRKTYESSSVKVNALNGIDLEFAKGRFYSVIGRSGSEKSTLLYILSGLDQPTEGKVCFEGKECFIWGRRSSGSMLLRYLDGSKVKDGVGFKKLTLLERSSNYLIT